MTKGMFLLIAVFGGFLAFAIWAFLKLWAMSGDSKMSVHGYIAMGLAGGLTLIVGGGLMWLAFYSARKGYDDIDRPED